MNILTRIHFCHFVSLRISSRTATAYSQSHQGLFVYKQLSLMAASLSEHLLYIPSWQTKQTPSTSSQASAIANHIFSSTESQFGAQTFKFEMAWLIHSLWTWSGCIKLNTAKCAVLIWSVDLFGVLTSVDWRVVCPLMELIWLWGGFSEQSEVFD